MAQITWRNVDAPNFTGVSESQRLSNIMLNQGLNALGGALDKYKENQLATAVGADALDLAGYKTQEELAAGIKSGAITPEALADPTFRAQVFARQGELAGTEGQNITNRNNITIGEGYKIDNQGKLVKVAQDTENLNQDKFLNENIRKEYTAMPAATTAISDILAMADGSPEGQKRAYDAVKKNMSAFTAAGMTGDAINTLMERIRTTTSAQQTQNTAFTAEEKTAQEAIQTKAAETAYNLAAQTNGTPQAIKSALLASNNPALRDPAVLNKAMAMADGQAAGALADGTAGGGGGGTAPTAGGGATAADALRAQQQRAGVQPGQPITANQFVAQDLPPEAYQFLGVTAGTESPGYNVLNGGEAFSDYGDHPRRVGAKGTTSAAGRYQFISDTWDRASKAIGAKDFSPENQDRAAWWLAQNDYKANTGRDLSADLKAGNYAAIKSGLGSTWEGLAKLSPEAFTRKMQEAAGQKVQLVQGPESAADAASSAITRAANAGPSAPLNKKMFDENISLINQSQSLHDRMTINNTLDATLPMLNAIAAGTTQGSEAETVNALHKTLQADNKGLTLDEVTDQINKIGDEYNVPPHIAAELAKNAMSQMPWGTRWLLGDLAIDDGEVQKFVRKFIDPDAEDGNARIKPAMELFRQASVRKANSDKIKLAQSNLDTAEKEYAANMIAKQTRPDVDVRDSARNMIVMQGELRKLITEVDNNPYDGGPIGGTAAAGGAGGSGQTVATAPADTTTPPAPDATTTAATPAPPVLTAAQQREAAVDAALEAVVAPKQGGGVDRSAQALKDAQAARLAAEARAASFNEQRARLAINNPNAKISGVTEAEKENARRVEESLKKAEKADKGVTEGTSIVGKGGPAGSGKLVVGSGRISGKSEEASELEKAVTGRGEKEIEKEQKILRDNQAIEEADIAAQNTASVKTAKKIAQKLQDRGIPEEDWPASLKKMLKNIKLPDDEDEE